MKADSARVTRLMPSPNFGDRRGQAIDALVLHYTGMPTGEAALARLCDPASNVSCHYLIWEDGRIDQLVAEADRAWHAGRSFWAGERDMNACSIGIEIVNAGHDGGCPPYPTAQIEAVIALCRDVCARYGIVPARVLAHSDIAPDRKIDPGEWFPWDQLAAAGVGLRFAALPSGGDHRLSKGDTGQAVETLQSELATIGFDAPVTGAYNDNTMLIVAAFQRHYGAGHVDGVADALTRRRISAVIDMSRGAGPRVHGPGI